MSSTAVAPVTSGVVSSIKSLPGKIGAVAGKVGGKIGPLVGKVADSKVVSWSGEQVRKIAVPDQVIRGWQDIYKGVKTLERGSRTIRTVKIIRDPGLLKGGKIASGAGKAAGSARGAASGMARGASFAGKAARGAKSAASGAARIARGASGVKGAAAGVARGGDLLLKEGTRVTASAGKVAIPGGFREVTKVDVTRAEFIGKSGQKLVRGVKFRLGGSGAAESLGRGMGKAAAGTGASGAGAGAGSPVAAEVGQSAGRGAASGARLARGAKVGKGAGTAAKVARGAKVGQGSGSVAKVARGARAARTAAGKGGSQVIETTTTVTRGGARGFKPPFGLQAIKQGLRNLFQGAMKAAKVSGILNFAISLVQNGYGVLSGQIGLPEAVGGIVRDTAAGFVAGGFAAVFSGGVLAIAGGLGLTAGLPVFLLGLGASLLGYTICNALFNAIIGDRLKRLVERLMGA